MQYPKILEELGFAQSEIKVYIALLELDSATVTEVSKNSGINRTSCYDVLEHLVKRGLVSKFRKKGKIYFTAGDPRRLLNYLDREKEEAEKKINQQKEKIKEILPELSSLIHPKSAKPKVAFYEGEKGMREAYEDTLTTKEGILAYANVETMHEGLPEFFPEYYARRAKAGIPIKAIMPNNKLSIDRAKKDNHELRESIILQDKNVTFSPEVNIYNDKMLIASWKEKMAVIIESKELADLQRTIFNLLWDYLKQKPA
ncbi:MAG: helix-turn-helix domain-containing protein [Patescibacteria group bacterium]|jgi:sugar-specific transcriptional regulator TrmB